MFNSILCVCVCVCACGGKDGDSNLYIVGVTEARSEDFKDVVDRLFIMIESGQITTKLEAVIFG